MINKKSLLILTLSLFSFTASFAQDLGMVLNYTSGKSGFNEATYDLSFTLEAPSRTDFKKEELIRSSTTIAAIKEIQVFVDDVRPMAVAILKTNVKNQQELEQLVKSIYSTWNLKYIILNGNKITESGKIHL